MPTFGSLPIDRALMRDLRSDHAGEVGAVQIYRGILAVSRRRVAMVCAIVDRHRRGRFGGGCRDCAQSLSRGLALQRNARGAAPTGRWAEAGNSLI